jgi:hypothetical protein
VDGTITGSDLETENGWRKRSVVRTPSRTFHCIGLTAFRFGVRTVFDSSSTFDTEMVDSEPVVRIPSVSFGLPSDLTERDRSSAALRLLRTDTIRNDAPSKTLDYRWGSATLLNGRRVFSTDSVRSTPVEFLLVVSVCPSIRMGTVDCPLCGESVKVGLPRDVATLEVSTEPDPTKPEDGRHKTRYVRCSRNHTIYFYFERESQGLGNRSSERSTTVSNVAPKDRSMSEDADSGSDAEAGDGAVEDDGDEGGPVGTLLMIGLLDLLLVGTALYAFSLGEPFAGGGILAFALVLTGIDVWLYRRGSF